MRYHATCYDKGNNEYAEIDVEANGFKHALQEIAARLPDEEPDCVMIYEAPWVHVEEGIG